MAERVIKNPCAYPHKHREFLKSVLYHTRNNLFYCRQRWNKMGGLFLRPNNFKFRSKLKAHPLAGD